MKTFYSLFVAMILGLIIFSFSGCNISKKESFKALNYFLILDNNYDKDFIIEKLDKWWQESQDIEKSSFSIWKIDEADYSYRCLLLIKIPDAWGGQIKRKKESFITEAVNAITDIKNIDDISMNINVSDEIVLGEDIILDLRKRDNRNRLLFDKDSTKSINVSVCVDLSSSTKGNPFDRKLLSDIYRSWYGTAYSRNNSTFSFYIIGNSYNDCSNIFNIKINNSISYGENYIYFASREFELNELLNYQSDNSRSSAILEAVYLANEQLNEQKENKYIYILSDGRQISTWVWNFEQLIPDSKSFVNWEKRNYPLNLKNVNIVMAGFHNKNSNDYGNSFRGADSKKIKALWKAVFSSAGATNIRLVDKYSSLF